MAALALSMEHKRGDTMVIMGTYKDSNGVPISLVGYQIKSQIRDADGALLETLTCSIIDPLVGRYQAIATHDQTSLWTMGTYRFDIQFTAPDGTVSSSKTIKLKVIEDQTL
ncbi:putative Bacteriophage protein [Gammaproteobacteria bacterium]